MFKLSEYSRYYPCSFLPAFNLSASLSSIVIERDPAKKNGRPIVEGTKIGVLQIHRLVRRDGLEPEGVAEAYEHRISVEEIEAALDFYDDHRDELEDDDGRD